MVYASEAEGVKENNYNVFSDTPDGKHLQNKSMIMYGPKKLQVIARKLQDESKKMWALTKTNLVIFMPSLLIINKSDWSFFIKGEGQKLKKLEKHSIEYTMISTMVGVQACEDTEEIAFN